MAVLAGELDGEEVDLGGNLEVEVADLGQPATRRARVWVERMGNLGPGGREEGNAGIRVGDVLARGYRQGILVRNFVRAEEGGKVSTIILGGREVQNLVGGRS